VDFVAIAGAVLKCAEMCNRHTSEPQPLVCCSKCRNVRASQNHS